MAYSDKSNPLCLWIVCLGVLATLGVSIAILMKQPKEKYCGYKQDSSQSMSWMMLMLSDNPDIGPVPIEPIQTVQKGKLWVTTDGKMSIDMFNNKITVGDVTYDTKSIGNRITWQAPKGKNLHLIKI